MKKCFFCEGKAKFWLKRFSLGMSIIPSAPACEECKKKVKKRCESVTIEPINRPSTEVPT